MRFVQVLEGFIEGKAIGTLESDEVFSYSNGIFKLWCDDIQFAELIYADVATFIIRTLTDPVQSNWFFVTTEKLN